MGINGTHLKERTHTLPLSDLDVCAYLSSTFRQFPQHKSYIILEIVREYGVRSDKLEGRFLGRYLDFLARKGIPHRCWVRRILILEIHVYWIG